MTHVTQEKVAALRACRANIPLKGLHTYTRAHLALCHVHLTCTMSYHLKAASRASLPRFGGQRYTRNRGPPTSRTRHRRDRRTHRHARRHREVDRPHGDTRRLHRPGNSSPRTTSAESGRPNGRATGICRRHRNHARMGLQRLTHGTRRMGRRHAPTRLAHELREHPHAPLRAEGTDTGQGFTVNGHRSHFIPGDRVRFRNGDTVYWVKAIHVTGDDTFAASIKSIDSGRMSTVSTGVLVRARV